MLESLLIDMGYRFGSRVADNVTAYQMIKSKGPSIESHVETRKAAERNELGNYLVKDTLKNAARTVVVGGALYGLDYLLNIDNHILNFHHLFLYGEGTLGYMAASSNIIMKNTRSGKIPNSVYLLAIPPYMFDVWVYQPMTRIGQSLKKMFTSRAI